MQLGFMTNILVKYGMRDFETVTRWAKEQGFDCMEVGPTFPLDQRLFEQTLSRYDMRISALTYCRNYLSSDPEEATHHRQELCRRIEFARALHVDKIVTSTGIDKRIQENIYDSADSIRRTPEKSLDAVVEVFKPILEVAEKNGVKLAFENCPLMGNIAISPVMWRMLLERLDSNQVGLAYDPSHLVWQMIDPYKHIPEFADRIIHVHAKDMHVDWESLRDTGFLTDFRWWHARIPGHGDLDWAKLIGILKECGYDGSISIEHEDKQYEGSQEKVLQGLSESKEMLRSLIREPSDSN